MQSWLMRLLFERGRVVLFRVVAPESSYEPTVLTYDHHILTSYFTRVARSGTHPFMGL